MKLDLLITKLNTMRERLATGDVDVVVRTGEGEYALVEIATDRGTVVVCGSDAA